MRKILLVILGLLICNPGYSKKHKHKKTQQAGSNIMSVTIHRTLCYGRCPDYMIEINSDGTTTYTGGRFAPDTGIFVKKIGAEKAMKIINQFETYRVDTCANGYFTRLEDLSRLIITIKYKDSTKTINNAGFGPLFLRQLAGTMDAIGKKTDSSWKKIGTVKIE